MMRPRVLLLAEVANPEFVSVPLIAWSLSEAIGRNVDAHLVSHIRNRDAILRQGWREGEDFTILDTEWATRRIWDLARLLGGRDNKGWTIHQALAPLGCFAFEQAAWQRFKPDLVAGRFDIVRSPRHADEPDDAELSRSPVEAAGYPVRRWSAQRRRALAAGFPRSHAPRA
jgi:hypothetical protein